MDRPSSLPSRSRPDGATTLERLPAVTAPCRVRQSHDASRDPRDRHDVLCGRRGYSAFRTCTQEPSRGPRDARRWERRPQPGMGHRSRHARGSDHLRPLGRSTTGKATASLHPGDVPQRSRDTPSSSGRSAPPYSPQGIRRVQRGSDHQGTHARTLEGALVIPPT